MFHGTASLGVCRNGQRRKVNSIELCSKGHIVVYNAIRHLISLIDLKQHSVSSRERALN